MASLAATLGDRGFKRTGGWADQPIAFRAAISVGAPYDLNALDWGTIWAPPGTDADAARKHASPIHHVSPKTIPILIVHSDDDDSVPVKQALDMVKALEKAKAPYRFVRFKDKGHLGITDDVIRETLKFVEDYSK
jgi:dipeptidyl aminopeptidase/acylaminoacyl peptidase